MIWVLLVVLAICETDFFTNAGADVSGCSTGKNPVLVNRFPRNYQRVPSTYTNRDENIT